jgi:hypothetical protein
MYTVENYVGKRRARSALYTKEDISIRREKANFPKKELGVVGDAGALSHQRK